MSQAGIAARTLILMQGSEEKEQKSAARIKLERETWQTRTLTTQKRRCLCVKSAIFNSSK